MSQSSFPFFLASLHLRRAALVCLSDTSSLAPRCISDVGKQSWIPFNRNLISSDQSEIKWGAFGRRGGGDGGWQGPAQNVGPELNPSLEVRKRRLIFIAAWCRFSAHKSLLWFTGTGQSSWFTLLYMLCDSRGHRRNQSEKGQGGVCVKVKVLGRQPKLHSATPGQVGALCKPHSAMSHCPIKNNSFFKLEL